MTVEELDDILAPPAPKQPAWRNFDHDWYLHAYSDVRSKIDDDGFAGVRQYYLDYGRALGHSPNRFFDEKWYRRRYADADDSVATGEIGSGYEHYCTSGYRSTSPHWLYDDAVYALFSQDLTDEVLAEFGCLNRYDHYIKSGARELRIAHLLFDPETYLQSTDGVGDSGEPSPFADFLHRVWFDRREATTSIFFDPAWYLDNHRDARPALRQGLYACALHHYLTASKPGSRDPLPQFSESFYREQYPDISAAIESGAIATGYDHFLRAGVFDLRKPAPDIDLRAFLADHDAARAAVAAGTCRNVFEFLLRHGAPRQAPPAAAPSPAPMQVQPAPLAAAPTGQGRLDFLGFHTPAHGWFFCGWVSPAHAAVDGPAEAVATYERGQVTGPVLMAPYHREDMAGRGTGLLVYLEGAGRGLGNLLSLTITGEGMIWTLLPADAASILRDAELVAPLRPVLASLRDNPAKAQLAALAARRGYTGANTLGELHDRVFFEVDEVIVCPPNSVLMIGWTLAAPGVVKAVRLHSGGAITVLPPERFVRIERPDVLNSVGAQYGLNELRCGFMLHIPGAFSPGEGGYLEVETTRGETGFRGLPEPKLRGMPAIRFILERFECRYDEVNRAFDSVVGPAIVGLNRERLRQPVEREVIDFGPLPAAPELSVVVPLYGRLDFMEYQFGLFSRHRPAIAHEFIYVLDDPTQRRQAEILAASIFARFGIPFRLVLLARNLGYAPANNIGVELARGRYVCFLNSDVIPDTDDWMERLVARLEDNPDLGAVGPLLLFEDRSVQHQGMAFQPLPEFGNWLFPIHLRKGWRPEETGGLRRADAITGACMVIDRQRLRALGGFDESFVIGDFEDSDLCMKLAERGLGAAVDLDVSLYHLERQSQAGSEQRWRMNLTLYNAWVHEGRWGTRLRAARSVVTPIATNPITANPADSPTTPEPEPPRTKRPAGRAKTRQPA